LNEIFDRFYKVDTFKQGTGLGLSICKTIVEHLQGDISVKSEIGKGSCFTVTLPFDRETED
jgi:two-component system histidine kinase